MNIRELLANTAEVKGYGGGPSSFKTKPFGTIYFYNKTVTAKPNSSIIEVSMMCKAVTDKIKPNAETPARPVAAHLTRIALHGVKQEVVTGDELVERMRATDKMYQDKKAFPKGDLIQSALVKGQVFFPGKTIMAWSTGKEYGLSKDKRPSSAEAHNDTYVIIDNQISDETRIKVWCSCSSYYWAFQYYNIKEKVNIYSGNGAYPEEYIPKTQKGREARAKNEPMRNPQKLPGCCKHVLMLLALLMDSEVIQTSKEGSEKLLKGFRLNIRRFDITKKLTSSGKDNKIKSFLSDYRNVKLKRKLHAATAGFSNIAGYQRQGWNRNLTWNPRSNNPRGGFWR